MNIEDVVTRFALIAGLSADNASLWRELCEDAVEEISKRLRPDADTQANERRLVAACAVLAFFWYTLYGTSSRQVESFSAGQVSLRCAAGKAADGAQRAWQEAKTSISDLLKDSAFCFQRV